MPEKEPTQSKLDEKTQQRLTEIDAELFVFKQKAKGDAKANLKLVEMERAKELILEKRELLGEKQEGRDPEEFLKKVFKVLRPNLSFPKISWRWLMSVDGRYVDMNKNAGKLLKDDFIDKRNGTYPITEWPEMGVGLDKLVEDLKGKRIKSVVSKEDKWFLEVIELKEKWDVKKEITEKDWHSMQTELERNREAGKWESFAWMAYKMKIIDPKRDLLISTNTKKEMQSLRATLSSNSNFSTVVSMMKIIDPNKDLAISKAEWVKMEKWLEVYRDRLDWNNFLRKAFAMKILDPNRGLRIFEDDWDHIKEKLERIKGGNFHEFMNMNSYVRVLDRTKTLEVTAKDWQKAREEIVQSRKNNYWNIFSAAAGNMKILAATSVKITDQGLEIKD